MFTCWFWDLRLERAEQDRIFDKDSDFVESILLVFFSTSLFKELVATSFCCGNYGVSKGMWMQFHDLVRHPFQCYQLHFVWCESVLSFTDFLIDISSGMFSISGAKHTNPIFSFVVEIIRGRLCPSNSAQTPSRFQSTFDFTCAHQAHSKRKWSK